MEQEKYAKNGQLVEAVKELNEMTEAEKQAIRPVDEGKFDAYHVQYNKKGELLHVSGYGIVKESDNDEVDLADAIEVLFNPNKHSKTYQNAKKRLGVTNDQINKARAVFFKEA